MTGTLYLGTSGYSYDAWKGTFYPEDLQGEHYLKHYASRFRTVELNNTFYRFPSEEALREWAGQVPADFRFAVKSNQRITHKHRLKDVEQVTHDFFERCRILGDKLGPILYQLPPQFVWNEKRLHSFLESLPREGWHAMEFRHRSWFKDDVYQALRDAGVALVRSDDGKHDVPDIDTGTFHYVRLRRESYTEAELDTWRTWIQDKREAGAHVFVFLKHDDGGTSPEVPLAQLETVD